MLKERTLDILERQKGNLVTGGQLARDLGVSRNAIWKVINRLKEEGYDIESIRNSGYRFVSDNDIVSATAIQKHLRTEMLGRSLEVLQTIDSTNTYLKRQDQSTLADGHSVLANEQTQGRGRLNRCFLSPSSEGIYLSMILKPALPIQEVQFLTICAAVAVCNSIEKTCEIPAAIKWVNDVYCKGKKICGILTEATISAELQTTESVIVGIGINTGTVPEALREIATSISSLTTAKHYRNQLTAEVLNQMEAIYFDFTRHGKKQEILKAYTEKQFIIGMQVTVLHSQGQYEAKVIGIDENGGLIVKDLLGKEKHLHTGEVSLKLGENNHAT